MSKKHELILKEQDVTLDGHQWTGCTFENCNIIVSNGDFVFSNNTVKNCRLTLAGNAINVASMIEAFYPGAIPFAPGARPNPRGKDLY